MKVTDSQSVFNLRSHSSKQEETQNQIGDLKEVQKSSSENVPTGRTTKGGTVLVAGGGKKVPLPAQ